MTEFETGGQPTNAEQRKAEIRAQDYAGSEYPTPVVTRHDDGTITMEWPEGRRSTLVAREVLEGMLYAHNAATAEINELRNNIGILNQHLAEQRPWLFEPGDHVLCLMPTANGQIIVSGVVQQIRIPGPLRTEKVIQVQMDDDNMFPEALGLAWWSPDLVERIHG